MVERWEPPMKSSLHIIPVFHGKEYVNTGRAEFILENV